MNRRKGQPRFDARTALRSAKDGLAGLWRRLGRGKNRRVRRPTAAAARAAAASQGAPLGAGGTSAGRGVGSPRRIATVVGLALGWLIPVAVAGGAFMTPLLGVKAYEYVMASGHFHVREVLVEGNRRLDYEAIRRAMGIEPGTHALASDLDGLAERLEADPWVSWARVRRELPDRLVVELVEHEPAAYLALGELWLVNARGEIFAEAEAGADLKLPIITGVDPGALAHEASRLEVEARLRGVNNVLSLYEAMGLGTRWPVGEVRLDATRGLTLVLSRIGTEAVLGHGPYRDKLFRLEWVLESLHHDGRVAEYVVLDAFAGADLAADAGRVVVKADLAPAADALMEQAAERAREAERSVLGLPEDPEVLGPTVTPRPSEDDGAGAETAPLTGGRPAVGPSDLDDGREE